MSDSYFDVAQICINGHSINSYAGTNPVRNQDHCSNGNEIDIILETPGGFAEVVEDLVQLVRDKYEKVAIIVPGYAKSAGTIFAMAGDEILMGATSALGPIDAQIAFNNKRFSAEAFLEGLDKIKEEIANKGKLNPAYIPILQNISPGEIQHCKNVQDFAKKLVIDWLVEYKFKYWNKHSTNNEKVTEDEKQRRANQIADTLCKQSEWLTHGRSIKINDLENMKLLIDDYSNIPELNEAILRYYTLLRMSFETNIYKLFETIESQIYRFSVVSNQNIKKNNKNNLGIINFECPKCNHRYNIQANIEPNIPLQKGNIEYPVDNDMFKCQNCGQESNLKKARLEIEARSGKKVVK